MKEKKKLVGIVMPPKLIEKVKVMADKKGLTINAMIIVIVNEYFCK